MVGAAESQANFLEMSADALCDCVPCTGYTPMHGAGFQGRAEIAATLIAAGLDVNDKHSDGHGPVQRACWGTEKRHTKTVKVMLENGATLTGEEIKRCTNPDTRKVLEKWEPQSTHREL